MMTDSSSRQHQADSNEFNPEDLTLIEGIGKVKQLWLQSIGINTLQALSEALPDALQTQLVADGHVAHTREVERWVTQAKTLLGQTDTVAETPIKSDSVDVANDTDECVDAPVDDSTQELEGWQTFAAFTIEFQAWGQGEHEVQRRTLVRHVATEREEIWSGIGAADLQMWLRSQVADVMPTAAEETENSVILSEDIDTPVTPVIEDLYLLQPSVTQNAMGLHKPNMLFPNPLKGNFPFSLALKFGIQEPGALAKLKQTVSYQVECYARSLNGGGIISLGELPKTKLLPQNSSYTAYLPTTRLRKGLYRLQVFLNLEGTQALPTFLEVPVLQVV